MSSSASTGLGSLSLQDKSLLGVSGSLLDPSTLSHHYQQGIFQIYEYSIFVNIRNREGKFMATDAGGGGATCIFGGGFYVFVCEILKNPYFKEKFYS